MPSGIFIPWNTTQQSKGINYPDPNNMEESTKHYAECLSLTQSTLMVGWYVYKILKQAELTYGEKDIRTMVVYRRMEEELARMGIKLSEILEIFQILTIVSVT